MHNRGQEGLLKVDYLKLSSKSFSVHVEYTVNEVVEWDRDQDRQHIWSPICKFPAQITIHDSQ